MLDTTTNVPVVVSKKNMRALVPINTFMSKEDKTNKGIKRKLEKFR